MAPTDDDFSSRVVPMPGDGTPPAASAAGPVPPPAAVTTPSSPSSAAPASARDFLKALENALGRVATLKVVTVVGEVSVSGAGADTAVAARPGAAMEAASTEVNLLDGHIVNVFSPSFSAAGGLQAFHQLQVEKSSDIVLRNLAELQKLASALATVRR